MRRRAAVYGCSAAIFLADRLTKVWVDASISAFDVWEVIPGFFNIIHSENRGMAFSLLAEASLWLRTVVLIGLSCLMMGAVALMLWKTAGTPAKLTEAALVLVLGGAAGNVYDRVMRGSVTDFLDFQIAGYHWATFNVADAAITCGAILMLLEALSESWRKKAAV